MSLKQRLGWSQEPLYLMDGTAFVYRGFFANANMTRSDGLPTGALYIVGRVLLKLLKEERPAHFAFIMDGPGKHFRHDLFPAYKANRPSAPEGLLAQIEPVRRMVRALGLHVEVSNGCEADDCLASLAARFRQSRPVVIVGVDKDLRQCLHDNVVLWDPAAREEKLITLASFREESGLEPEQWPDVQALVGDSSDNVPGVRGIGPKTAEKLFQDFRNLEDVRDRLAAVPPTVRKKLDGNVDAMFLYRQLTTLRLDCCQHLTPENFAPRPVVEREILALLREFEMGSLLKELESLARRGLLPMETAKTPEFEAEAAPRNTPGFESAPGASSRSGHAGQPPKGEAGQFSLLTAARKESEPVLPTVAAVAQLPPCAGAVISLTPPPVWGGGHNTSAGHTFVMCVAVADMPADMPADIATDTVATMTPNMTTDMANMSPAPGGVEGPQAMQAQQSVQGHDTLYSGPVEDLVAWALDASLVICPDYKKLLRSHAAWRALPPERCFDLGLAAYLLAPEDRDYSWPRLSALHAQSCAISPGRPASLALDMYRQTLAKLEKTELLPLLRTVEMPLVPVLADMEEAGIMVNREALYGFLEEVQRDLDALTARIYQEAGGEFNIRSAQQIGEVLFKRLGLPVAKSTRGGQASTSQEVLEKLTGHHPVVDILLEFRKLEKLRSTYLEPLPRMADAKGRIHSTFNQSATATGRLSSSNPNLQNIPVRGDMGRRMRACFTAGPGNALISADYSQIELRVLAHYSQDPTLLAAFRSGEDIHTRTAALLHDTDPASIGPDQRREAKTINFGLIYGMGARKLAQELGIGLADAKVFMERYFARFSHIKEFYDQVEEQAREQGFVTTLSGRRRPLPDMLSQSAQSRALAERQAVNTLIQGSAADIIKLAMLAVYHDDTLRAMQARLILQVHDELVLEAPYAMAEQAAKRMAELMQFLPGMNLSVPLVAEWSFGEHY